MDFCNKKKGAGPWLRRWRNWVVELRYSLNVMDFSPKNKEIKPKNLKKKIEQQQTPIHFLTHPSPHLVKNIDSISFDQSKSRLTNNYPKKTNVNVSRPSCCCLPSFTGFRTWGSNAIRLYGNQSIYDMDVYRFTRLFRVLLGFTVFSLFYLVLLGFNGLYSV